MPEFDREGGARRLFHLIEFLCEGGWAVSFVAQNASGGERYARALQQMGVATYASGSAWAGGQESLINPEVLLATGHFDLVLIAFWDHAEAYLPLVRSRSPHSRVVIDSVDLHFLRKSRGAFCAPGASEAGGRLDPQYASEMIRELNVYAAADAVLTVSRKEADLVNDFVGDSGLAHAVPDTEDMPASPLPLAERKGVLFIGNFRHPPNVQAVQHLSEDILPRVPPELLAAHPVYVVGNGLEEVVGNQEVKLKGLTLIGWVPQVSTYLQRARISVIPLLYGAGTKRKLMQSLLVGTPCVSTTIGVEGLDLDDGVHVLVADDASKFAESIQRLLTDDELWHRLKEEGRGHVLAAHGREAVRASFDSAFARVMSRPVKSVAV